MDLTMTVLCAAEWTNRAEPEVRLRFRKDGSGYYHRAVPSRPIVEKLLYKLEGGVLQVKLARARSWVSLEAAAAEGEGKPGDRFGQRALTLSKDPYAAAIEDQPSGALVLASDEGASLPSA